jgi:hypothetical protein
VWTTVRTWDTGISAQFEDADIKYHLELASRNLMHESEVIKLPRHKENKSDLGMFKKNQSHTNSCCVKFTVYQCPLHRKMGCPMVIRVVIGPDYIELQRSGSHCHDQEYTNDLTIQQILSIQQAARTAP